MAGDDQLRDQIREILLKDWDPTNASRSEAASGEYDADIRSLQELMEAGAEEDAIVDYLFEREHEIMCFPGLGKQHLHRVARKLLGLKGR